MPLGIPLPREEIPWYPTVDYDNCAGCQQCLEFCPNGVYVWDENDHHPRVINPYNCVVGCSACARMCPMEAITFPSREELIAAVRAATQKVLAANPYRRIN